MKTASAIAFLLLQTASMSCAAAQDQPSGGAAISDFWTASAAEYQAGVEALLTRLGARNIERPDLAEAAMADFLLIFGGGGGAPLDLVRPRRDHAGAE